MKRSSHPLLLAILFTNLICFAAKLTGQDASDWPAFRGKDGKGVSDNQRLPVHWNTDPENDPTKQILWQTEIPGLGHSSPVISGNRIFVLTAIASQGDAPLKVGAGGRPEAADDNGEQEWVVLCYDKQTGQELWRQVARKGLPRATRHAKATHANTSVAVQGDRVVAFFGSEGLYCYTLDGKLLWKRDLGVVDISKYGIGWGYASSPAIHQNRIALICDDPNNPYLALFDLANGEELWRVSRSDICERNWSTPLIHQTPDRTQIVINGWPWIVSYEMKSGKELWRIKGGGDNPVPTPFVAHGWIYITSSHGGQSPIYVVRPDAAGDVSPAEDDTPTDSIVWSTRRGGSYMSTPVVYGDYLYLGNSNGVLRCFHAKTGDKVYQERLGSDAGIIASLVAADGKIYCPSENGTVYVVAAGPEFKLLAENQMGQPCFASPALSDSVLFIRTTGKLFAIQAASSR